MSVSSRVIRHLHSLERGWINPLIARFCSVLRSWESELQGDDFSTVATLGSSLYPSFKLLVKELCQLVTLIYHPDNARLM